MLDLVERAVFYLIIKSLKLNPILVRVGGSWNRKDLKEESGAD